MLSSYYLVAAWAYVCLACRGSSVSTGCVKSVSLLRLASAGSVFVSHAGSIPLGIRKLVALITLNVMNNGLTGKFGESLFDLPNDVRFRFNVEYTLFSSSFEVNMVNRFVGVGWNRRLFRSPG